MKSASQKREHVIIVPGGLLAPRPHADPGCSIPPHEVNGDLAQNGQVARCRAIPNAAVILAKGDIQDPMEPVVSRPEGFHLRPLSEGVELNLSVT